MVGRNGASSTKRSSFMSKTNSVSQSLVAYEETPNLAERRAHLCQQAVKHLQKVILEVAKKGERHLVANIYRQNIEKDFRLLRCMDCLLTVSHHCRSYAVSLIIEWMKEFQSNSNNSKFFLEELISIDGDGILLYVCQLRTLQLLLDKMFLEKCEIPKNLLDDILSLTVEELINLAKNWDNECSPQIGFVLMVCSDFLGSLSMFSLHEILIRFQGKMLNSAGSTSLSSLFSLRDSENENLFYLSILKGLRISLLDSSFIKSSTQLLEFYRSLLTGTRSTAIKHMIADNISVLLLQNVQFELCESTSMAKWYKTIDDLYSLLQKWLTKPKHMAKGFPVCALLLKAKHVDVLKKELWPFIMRCCKQYEDSKELQLRIATAKALSHALKMYITTKDTSSILTEQLEQILKKLLSPDRMFSQACKDLYDILAKCVMIVIHFSPLIWINLLEEWWQNNKLFSLSEVSYVFYQVAAFSLKDELLLRDEDLCDDGMFDKSQSAVDWSPENKLKLAQMSCKILRATYAYLDRTKSQVLSTLDPSDVHCLLKLQLKGVHCLLSSICEKEMQSLYAPVTDMACQTDCCFIHEAESLLLDMCNQAEDAEESVLYQISLKFNFRKSNPLDLSYSHVGRVIQVFNQVLTLQNRTESSKLVEKSIGGNLRTLLLRFQETSVLLYFLPSVDLRRNLRDSLTLIQTLMFGRTCSELEAFSAEDKLVEMHLEELKPRSTSRGTNDELSYEFSSTARFSRFLCTWRSFLSFTVRQSPENSKAGIVNAEQMLLYLNGNFEQSFQSNVKLHDRFPGFQIVNISFLESIELYFSLFFYILCSIHEQCKLASSGITGESRSQLRKIFQSVLSPSLLGIDGTKSPLCTIYSTRLLEALKNVPSDLSLCIALEAEELTFSSPHVQQTKGRSKRQKDHYRIYYTKILLALLSTLNETDKCCMNNGVLELYSRFFSKMLQIMGQSVENPQNPFDLMALRETFCLCLLKALSAFIAISSFSVHFKGIWKDALLLMQRWIASSNARKYSSASRGSSIFRTSFHDRSSREESFTVEDLQDRIRKLSLICVTVLLGYAESFGISKEVFHSVSFHLDSLLSNVLEELKIFDSNRLEKLQCDYSMLKPAIVQILSFDNRSLRILMELSVLPSNHSNEVVAYHAVLLLLEYIHRHYDREEVSLRSDKLCIELFSLVYFVMGWDRECLFPLALKSLVSLVSVATKNFTYEFSLEFHEYFPSLCQDENFINDISKRSAILCAEVASNIVSSVFAKIEQSIKDNAEYDHSRILSFLEPWLERGDIAECTIEELLSLEETTYETFRDSKLILKAFDALWHALGYRKDNLQRALNVLFIATRQKLKQSNKRNNEILELIKRAAVKLSENRVGFFLLNILSYVIPSHVIEDLMNSCKEAVPECERNRQFDDIPIVVVLLSETIQRNSEDIRAFLPIIFHLSIFTQTSNNISQQKHGRLLLANVLSRFLLPHIERCCRQDIWRQCVQLSAQIAADMQQLSMQWNPQDIACSPEEMLSPRDGDLHLFSFLEKLIGLSSYGEPQLRTLWSRHCLALIKYRLGQTLGVVSLRLYRLLGPCLDKDSVDTLLSCAKNEFFSNNPDRYRISHLLQILYLLATKVEKENLVTVPPMLSFAFELSCSNEPWIRLHAAYLFMKLYSTGNSVGEGIFNQLVETEFYSGLHNSPTILEICKLAISTTQLQKSEHVIFIYLTLLLRLPWRPETSKQKNCLVPVIVTSFIFLTTLLVSQNDHQKTEDQVLQLYRQTISDTDLPVIRVEHRNNSIAYFRITCVHLCYILKRLHLSSLAETLQNFCNSRKYWKVEDFLYQLRSPLLSFWLENTQTCHSLLVAWLETNNSLSYRRGVLRLIEAILVQAGQQNNLSKLLSSSSDILKILISLVDGALHEEVIHLLELLD